MFNTQSGWLKGCQPLAVACAWRDTSGGGGAASSSDLHLTCCFQLSEAHWSLALNRIPRPLSTTKLDDPGDHDVIARAEEGNGPSGLAKAVSACSPVAASAPVFLPAHHRRGSVPLGAAGTRVLSGHFSALEQRPRMCLPSRGRQSASAGGFGKR